MKKTGYLTVEDIVPPDFLNSPRSIVIEAGNGQGKTHAAAEYAVSMQKVRIFDRIYVLEYSQKSAENVVNKILKLGGWAVHHVGLEKFCPFYKQMKAYIEAGIPANLFCYTCPFFNNKSRIAYLEVTQNLQNPFGKVIKPEIVQRGLSKNSKYCTHPVVRAYILDPAHEIDRRVSIPETPIIVVAGQLFLNHGVIGRWWEFGKRQRKERKTLLIIDEADTLFYSALKTEVPALDITQDDYKILQQFSPKTRPLPALLDIYRNIVEILEKIHRNRNRFNNEDVAKIERLLISADPLIRSFSRRKKEIAKYVIQNKVKTNVFRVALTIDELKHIESLGVVLKTLEETNTDFVLYDYDYALHLFFDNSYPWRHFWKIVLSATFPSEKLIESEFVSAKTKRLLERIERRSKTYENVYTSTIRIFDDIEGVLNRNREIEYSLAKIIKAVKLAVSKYKEVFKVEPKVCLWFGNSTQMNKFVSKLAENKIKIVKKRSYAFFRLGNIPIFCSYCGSSISRGIDLNDYDISIVVGPLLRSPRHSGVLDILDFSRGISEAVQSAMRIVRSPRPDRPKMIIVEKHMATSFYSAFYPNWFKELFLSSRIKIEENS